MGAIIERSLPRMTTAFTSLGHVAAGALLGGVALLAANSCATPTSDRAADSHSQNDTSSSDVGNKLLLELRGLSVRELRWKTVVARISAEAVEDARDSEDPKAALVALLVEEYAKQDGGGAVLAAIKAADEGSMEAIISVLEHGSDVLDALSSSAPRKSRKALLELLEHVEAAVESVDRAWCEGLAKCRPDDLEELGACLVAVKSLDPNPVAKGAVSDAVTKVSTEVSALLGCVARCSSAVLHSVSVLSAGADGGAEQAARGALEVLRSLSEDLQQTASAEELLAVDAVLIFMEANPSLANRSCTVRVCAAMAFFKLGCRNGFAVCGSAECRKRTDEDVFGSLTDLVEAKDEMAELWEVVSAVMAAAELVWVEGPTKTPSTCRPREAEIASHFGRYFGLIKSFSRETVARLIDEIIGSRLLQHDDASVACGAAWSLHALLYMHTNLAEYAHCAGLFGQVWELYRRVCPSDLSFLAATSAVVDARSTRLLLVWGGLMDVRGLPASTLTSAKLWWAPLIQETIKIVKLNESAKLSGQDTMSFFPIVMAYIVLEVAAQDEAQHKMLLDANVLAALEHSSAHDFVFGGISLAPYAAGTAVSLVGKNEGGKTLTKQTILVVLRDLKLNLGTSGRHFRSTKQPAAHVPKVRRVATIAISDANKAHMLECDDILDTLAAGLLLGSPRRDENGAETLQEACVGVLLQLALFGPWAEVMRADKRVLDALRAVRTDDKMATATSRQSAERALFQLEDKRKDAVAAGSQLVSGSKHLMVSYCWAQQLLIKRIHTALVSRGYAVWIDVEQMKGSTVDAMALAVEGACVMLMGVSREYKESTNCRLEAQYAMQREVETVPLMLSEGYQADGWLGFMIGTRLWYGFYGDVLSVASLFEGKVSEVCRELGDRGYLDAGDVDAGDVDAGDVDVGGETRDGTGGDDECAIGELRSELRGLKPRELRQRLSAAGMSKEAVDDAEEADDAKAALIELLISRHRALGTSGAMVLVLEAGGEAVVELVTTVLEQAAEVAEGVSMATPRKERKAARELVVRVESLMESVDAEWCECLCAGSDATAMEEIATLLARVKALPAADAVEDATAAAAAITEIVECLERHSSATMQAKFVLRAGLQCESKVRLHALQALSELPASALAVSSEEEAAVFSLLSEYVDGREGRSMRERTLGFLGLVALGCRNGASVLASSELVEMVGRAQVEAFVSTALPTADVEVFELAGAVQSFFCLLVCEAPAKFNEEQRAQTSGVYMSKCMSGMITCVTEAFAEEGREAAVVSAMVQKHRVLEHSDLRIACAAAWHLNVLLLLLGQSLSEHAVNELDCVSNVLQLFRRLCPSPHPPEWWISKHAVVDETCLLICGAWGGFYVCARVAPTRRTKADMMVVLEEAVRMVKINQSAELSARKTMTFWPVAYALDVIERAAQDEPEHKALLDAGVADALEYACVHDFQFSSNSIASKAAGAVCYLMGRNEGGKSMSRQTVFALLDDFKEVIAAVRAKSNQTTSLGGQRTVTKRLAIMAVSDTNISLMLHYEGLLGILVDAVEACESRRDLCGNSSAEELHEGLVGVLLRLALHEAGAKALQAHEGAMAALRRVEGGGGGGGGVAPTEEARRLAESALFQLRGRGAMLDGQRSAERGRSPAAPKHVMMSYCWAQQSVVKRVHVALVQRGFRIWIDVEQMKGSTVDAMALAVEGACGMLMGVSREYKESTNCRLEAQYAMQREVETVPLMLSEGYQADGWLGFMIGTRLWYGFYGDVLSVASLFEGKVSEVCRELGDRGYLDERVHSNTPWRSRVHSDTLVAAPNFAEPSDDSSASARSKSDLSGQNVRELGKHKSAVGASEGLVGGGLKMWQSSHMEFEMGHADQLLAMPVKVLRGRARDRGATAEQLETAAESEDTKQALVALLLEIDGHQSRKRCKRTRVQWRH
eukprot:SAG11_NODE_345_length_10432_cov_276.637956_3_plen_1926_part_00